MRMYSYCRASSAEQLLDRAAVGGARPIELIRAGEDVETGLVLDDQLAQELAIEPVQVVDRVEQAVARPHAEEQRDLAEARLQIDDDRRALAEPRQLDAAVDRRRSSCRRRPWRRRTPASSPTARAPCAVSRRAAVRRTAPWKVSSVGRPGEELVGAGAHRLQDQLGIGARRDREDAGAGARRRAAARCSTSPTTRRRGCRRSRDRAASRRATARSSSTLTGIAPARSRRPKCFLNCVVFGDDETYELRHGRPTSASFASSAW